MLETHLRQAATVLLQSAIQIAPPDARQWGQAMQSELAFVEGPWAALMWALGGASVMAKHALAALFIPGRGGQGVNPDGIFETRISLPRAALAGSAACILGALLFFWAPPFRQAVHLSIEAWKEAVRPAQRRTQPGLESVAKLASAKRDPEGLAFVAVRIRDDRESARLANEAVKIDPTKTWIYAVIAVRRPFTVNGDWASKLKTSDPQNAFIHLIDAQSVRNATLDKLPHVPWKSREAEVENDPAWRAAMAAAFASPRFDDYNDRVASLDRKVEQRYRFDDPYEVMFGAELTGLVTQVKGIGPDATRDDSQRFGMVLLKEGQELQNRGERQRAAEKYWQVARFGQLLDAHAHWLDHHDGAWLQARAYQRLGMLADNRGDHNEAALFAYLTGKFDSPLVVSKGDKSEWAWGHDISMRNGSVFQLAGLMMLLLSALFVSAAVCLVVVGLTNAKPGRQRFKLAATAVSFASAVGVLLASATVYLTYRPYWYILQHAIQTGDSGQTRDLAAFLISIRSLAVIEAGLSADFQIYLWAGVTLVCVLGLLLILLRHFPGRPHAHAP